MATHSPRAPRFSLERVAPDIIEIIARKFADPLAPTDLCSLISTCSLIRMQLQAMVIEVQDLRADARSLWRKSGNILLPSAAEDVTTLNFNRLNRKGLNRMPLARP